MSTRIMDDCKRMGHKEVVCGFLWLEAVLISDSGFDGWAVEPVTVEEEHPVLSNFSTWNFISATK